MSQALQAIVKGRFPDGSETRSMFSFEWVAFTPAVQANISSYLGDFYTAAAPALSSDWDGYSVEVIELTGVLSDPLAEFPFVASGSVTGEMLPHTDAYLLIGKTQKKRTQGKKYLPGVPESLQNGGIVQPSALTDLVAAASAYIAVTGSGADELFPGVYDKAHQTFERFSGSRVPNVIATQRRRRQGRGI